MSAPANLRQLAGDSRQFGDMPLVAGETVFLLIDYQGEYAAGPLALPQLAPALAAAEALLDWARSHGVRVVHVHHHAPSPTARLFAPGSAGAAPLPGLVPASGEAVVLKAKPSAFAGTGLAALLQAAGARSLVVAGLMTHNCVDATAREAFHLGWRVVVAGDACATRDLPGPLGGVVSAADVHAAVLAGLNDRMAEVLSCRDLMACPLR